MTISYAVIGGASLFLWFITPWTPAELLKPWSGKAKVIFVLGFICVGLILLLVAVIDGARRLYIEAIAPLNATIESQKWLTYLAKHDREVLGTGVAVAGCEVSLDLECSKAWAEFRITVFDGSLYPIAVGDATGFISFANGSDETRKLTGALEMISKQMSAENCQRHNRGHFTLRQQLSPDDARFIDAEASRDGYFLFDNLKLTVRAHGVGLDDIPVGQIPTSPHHVLARLRGAVRADATALEAKRKAHNAKVHVLAVALGLSVQVYMRLNRTEMESDNTTADTIKNWRSDVMEVLRRGYSNDEAQSLFESLCDKFPLDESNIGNQRRWVGDFVERLRKRIDQDHQNRLLNYRK